MKKYLRIGALVLVALIFVGTFVFLYQKSRPKVTPIDGLILDVPIKVGNSVIMSNTFNDGTTIATVADMSDLIFRGNVDETEVGRLYEGIPVSVTVGALQDLVPSSSRVTPPLYILESGEAKRQRFSRRQVMTGISDGLRIEIREGLGLDERVRGLEQ